MTDTRTCPACQGRGYLQFSTRSPAGYRRDHERDCLRCDGDGTVEDWPEAPPSGLYAYKLPADGQRAVRATKALSAAYRGD